MLDVHYTCTMFKKHSPLIHFMYENMIETSFFSLRATVWMVLLLSPAIYAQGCGAGLYGPQCQYECHCTGNICDDNGECTNSATCVKGWFGPQCQYVDLTYTQHDGTTIQTFRDADDTTCNPDLNHQTVAITFRRAFPFTWLRLLVRTGGLSLSNIEVTFTDGDGNGNIPCDNRKNELVDNRTIDIHCDVSVEVKKVQVVGVAVGYLCSFYIMGACQEGFYGTKCQMQCSTNCVDEKCDNSSGRCDQCQAGTTGDFCDETCRPTTWGPGCVNPCSGTCRNHQCDSVTGHCDECPSGKTGDQCNQNCPPTQYGSRCVDNCSANCANRQCAGDNGRCNQCPAGKTGDHCDQICADGKYGIDCKKTCSINCKVSNHCDSLNGTCFDGCIDGYMGDLCEDECEHGKYGSKCSDNCSAFCNTNGMLQNESPCHHISGTCLYGCVQGYVDLACHTKAQTSSPDSEPGVGVGVGIGVGVMVLVGVAVLGVYFYRKRKLTQKAKRERPLGYDPADPTTEEHNYNELFKSHDNYNLPTDEVSSSVTLHVPSKNSTVDNVQYVNADVNADVNQYEDIDQMTSESDQGQSSKAGENNSGYANC